MLAEFESVMSRKIGRTSSCQHRINFKEALSVQPQPYCLPHMYRNAVEKEIEEMIKESELANSEWVSPMVITQKKNDNSPVYRVS